MRVDRKLGTRAGRRSQPLIHFSVKYAAACLAALTTGIACTSNGVRYSSAREIADVLIGGGIACMYTPARLNPDPRIVPPDESWGGCTIGHSTVAIYVLGNHDALSRLKTGEAGTADDTPRIYWCYGDNWFVAAGSASLRDRIHDVLGGSITDNMQL